MKLADNFTLISIRREDFRVSFSPPFWIILVATLAITESMFLFSGNSSPQVLFFILPFVVTVLCASAVLAIRSTYHFELGPDGIQIHGMIKSSPVIPWDSIDDFKIVRTAGLEYLQVQVRGAKRPLSLPLFVNRFHSLQKLLMLYTERSFTLNERLEKLWR